MGYRMNVILSGAKDLLVSPDSCLPKNIEEIYGESKTQAFSFPTREAAVSPLFDRDAAGRLPAVS